MKRKREGEKDKGKRTHIKEQKKHLDRKRRQ